MGDADAVKATALGMKNLQRVAKMLMSATAYKEGEHVRTAWPSCTAAC